MFSDTFECILYILICNNHVSSVVGRRAAANPQLAQSVFGASMAAGGGGPPGPEAHMFPACNGERPEEAEQQLIVINTVGSMPLRVTLPNQIFARPALPVVGSGAVVLVHQQI